MSLSTLAFSACSAVKPVSNDLEVSVHGVNYTADTFSYVVRNPADKSDKGTGELIDPFAAGGTVCCYQLPKQWKAGIQINIDITKWLQKKENNKLQEVKEQYLVEVPRYVNGTPGELWVMRNPDGSIGAISSNYQPNHPL
ncbi:hypothetical protein GJA_3153 [Janthinobacterium agaricidamnosum NBRC 102515 = DSM 9628]|uniref:Uncharacterized protein n=1 Tax=Janthinobacterium agaricidamnosum NBRC 102515 = DSM 9628 TaxID=1349767 RepID=W0V823_9BURK|nr:hypothetical protein GJA_3153 [Janthinobacterium agaricidamnosum NBRC 102515 = DSM 9628]